MIGISLRPRSNIPGRVWRAESQRELGLGLGLHAPHKAKRVSYQCSIDIAESRATSH